MEDPALGDRDEGGLGSGCGTELLGEGMGCGVLWSVLGWACGDLEVPTRNRTKTPRSWPVDSRPYAESIFRCQMMEAFLFVSCLNRK